MALSAAISRAAGPFACTEVPAWRQLFDNARIDGTMVLVELGGSTTLCANPVRAARRFSPASTFKIANTLIGLETGVVIPESRFSWDQADRGLPSWNQDQTLRSAYQQSVVWVYQSIARNVGVARMQGMLKRFGYGNEQTGNAVDQFWLNGALQISAIEQARFLARLWAGKVGLSDKVWPAAQAILLEEDHAGYRVFAKSGWDGATNPHDARFIGFVPPAMRGGTPQVGWYVGVVERDKKQWAFALNIDLTRESDPAQRKQLGRAILKQAGALP